MGGLEEPASPLWMKEYIAGAVHAVHGMLVSKEFDGMTFSEVANMMYERSGVFALAHLYDGKLNINPSRTVRNHPPSPHAHTHVHTYLPLCCVLGR